TRAPTWSTTSWNSLRPGPSLCRNARPRLPSQGSLPRAMSPLPPTARPSPPQGPVASLPWTSHTSWPLAKKPKHRCSAAPQHWSDRGLDPEVHGQTRLCRHRPGHRADPVLGLNLLPFGGAGRTHRRRHRVAHVPGDRGSFGGPRDRRSGIATRRVAGRRTSWAPGVDCQRTAARRGPDGARVGPNQWWYLIAWVILGLGMSGGLYSGAFAVLGHTYGSSARSAITLLTLFGGFASTIC